MSAHEWAEEYLRRVEQERDAIWVPRRRRRGWPGLPAEPPPEPGAPFVPDAPYLEGRSHLPDGRACWVAICWECAHVTRWPIEFDDTGHPRPTAIPQPDHVCDAQPDPAGLRALADHDSRAAERVMGLDEIPVLDHDPHVQQ